jgi:tetratricopeptide (TPR) repeat protein
MGVLLYFLVSGDYPVHLGGLSVGEAIDALSRRKPLMDLRPDLPESLLRAVSTATEIDPAKRFQSAGQLANALAESLGTHVPVDVSAPMVRQRKRRPVAWIMAGMLSLAVVLAASLVWYGSRQRPPQPPNVPASSLNGATGDEFQKAQDELLHSYKESALKDAVKGFQAVLQADPNNALAKARLGASYLVQHGYTPDPKLLDLAKQVSRQAIAMNGGLAAPHITLAQIAALEGQNDLAMQEIQIALGKEPRSAEVYGARGEVYEAQHRREEAIKDYNQAITLDPGDWRWPMSLGVAEYRMGNMAEALNQWQKAAALAPDNAVAFYDLSLAHRQTGKLEQAQQELEQAIRLDPTAKKYAALGSLLMFQGKYEQAAEMEQKAIALDPEFYTAYGNLGAAYLWSGKNRDKAMEAYRKAVGIEEAEHATKPKDTWLLAMLAEGYAVLGDSARSLILARQALALEPDDPALNYKIGGVFELLGQRGEAIPLIAKALANGYNAYEFEHDPTLAGLRADPKFASALHEQKTKK